MTASQAATVKHTSTGGCPSPGSIIPSTLHGSNSVNKTVKCHDFSVICHGTLLAVNAARSTSSCLSAFHCSVNTPAELSHRRDFKHLSRTHMPHQIYHPACLPAAPVPCSANSPAALQHELPVCLCQPPGAVLVHAQLLQHRPTLLGEVLRGTPE